jgi:GH25 family lysozyme M1 (1,4-beta-N-acetylmuramidase)
MRYQMGVDVSEHNGEINWALAKCAGVDFAIIRASCGLIEDKLYRKNTEKAAEVGIVTGTYGYFYPKLDPIKQAQLLSDLSNLYPHHMLPAGDLEENFSMFKMPERLKRWDAYMTTLDAGQKANLCWEYIGKGHWETYMHWTSFIRDLPAELYRAMFHPLWQPAWRQGLPDQFFPFLHPLIQQFTNKGYIPGFLTRVDINRTLLTIKELGEVGRHPWPIYSQD